MRGKARRREARQGEARLVDERELDKGIKGVRHQGLRHCVISSGLLATKSTQSTNWDLGQEKSEEVLPDQYCR